MSDSKEKDSKENKDTDENKCANKADNDIEPAIDDKKGCELEWGDVRDIDVQ